MHNSSSRQSSPWHTLVNRIQQFEKPLAGILLAAGVMTIASAGFAQGSEVPIALLQAQSSMPAPLEANDQPLADGVYLYGQSPEPEQIGSAYMVFEVNDQNIVGAFYMPSSSFDCFHGEMQSNQLALTVINSYEQTAYPYEIALAPDSSVAVTGGDSLAPVTLEGYHRIATVSDNDQRILATCQVDLQGQ